MIKRIRQALFGAGRSQSLLQGSLLYVGYRWFDRFLGIINLVVLARILTPEHFGIVAMASIVVGLLNAFFDMGIHVVVLQKDEPSKEFLDSAWTIRLIQSGLIGVVLAGAAPFAADYFNEPRVAGALYVLAAAGLVYGLENLAVVEFQRARRFSEEFRLAAIRRVITFAVVIALAVVLQSYWALVIGTLISRILGVVLSYWFYPVLHRISFAHGREVFNKGAWLLLGNGLEYVWVQIDVLFLGRRFSTALIGGYTIASEIARMPTSELLAPISRALLPGFASIRHDAVETRRLILSALNIQTSLALPAATGLALCGTSIAAIALGPKWDMVGELLLALPAIYAAASLRYAGEYYLLAVGRQRMLAAMDGTYIAIFLAGIGVMVFQDFAIEVMHVIVLRFSIEVLGILFVAVATARVSGDVSLWDQLLQTLRPLLATTVMAAGLVQVGVLELQASIVLLVAYVAAGGVLYVAALTILWLAAGRPGPGIEAYVYDRLIEWRQGRASG